MKDFLGNEIEIGDVGVCLETGFETGYSSAWLAIVRVTKFSPKNIYVTGIANTNDSYGTLKMPERFVKIRPEDMAMALLQKK